jgi:glycosyltransferase involved in cell wall biosynthesis
MMSKRITYLINQYPMVSHSFVRREIQALERLGYEVQRISVRGWNAALVDGEDVRERERTRFLLGDGLFPLALATLRTAVSRPVSFVRALRLAARVGRSAVRPLPVHFIYLAEACRMLSWLAEHGSQHVHAHFGTNATEVAMLAHELGGPKYSFTVHGPEEFDKPEFLHLGEKIRRSAFVVAVSSYGSSQLRRWVDAAHWSKLWVVHCGLDPEFCAAPPAQASTVPRLVCVGRLCEQKGQLLLVAAAAKLAQAGTEFELVLVGDGEMRRRIEAEVHQCGLGARVRITGWLSSSQVRDELVEARALVLPSFAEGLPVVLMEAMALRRPVISTYVAGIPELVVAGESGWLVPAGDVDALTQAMQAALEAPPELLERMGRLARRRVLSRHSIDREAARLAAHVETAISGREFSGGAVDPAVAPSRAGSSVHSSSR